MSADCNMVEGASQSNPDPKMKISVGSMNDGRENRGVVALAAVLILTLIGVPGAIAQSDVPLRDGTAVHVKLMQFVSSETSRAGDVIRFTVAADVTANSVVAINGGTLAAGTILEASPYRLVRGWLWWLGWRPQPRAGRLVLAVQETRSVDGQTIRLRASSATQGRISEDGLTVGKTPALIRWAHEGARFDVHVDGDYTVKR